MSDIPLVPNVSKGAVVLHRNGAAGTDYFLNANDGALPAVGSGVNLSSWGNAKISCLISGDPMSFDLVPLLGSPDAVTYVSGDARTVTGNQSFTIEVAGCPDFYTLCRAKTGTAPGIKVYVQGYNL